MLSWCPWRKTFCCTKCRALYNLLATQTNWHCGNSHGAGDSASSLLRGQRALTHAVHSWELPTCQDLAEPFKCTISFNPRNTRRSRCCCYAGSSLQVRIPTCRASETHPSTKLGMGSQPWARTQAGLDTPSWHRPLSSQCFPPPKKQILRCVRCPTELGSVETSKTKAAGTATAHSQMALQAEGPSTSPQHILGRAALWWAPEGVHPKRRPCVNCCSHIPPFM